MLQKFVPNKDCQSLGNGPSALKALEQIFRTIIMIIGIEKGSIARMIGIGASQREIDVSPCDEAILDDVYQLDGTAPSGVARGSSQALPPELHAFGAVVQ